MANKWRKKFDQAQVPPPEALWDKIASDLDANKRIGFVFPPFLGWAATIGVFALSGALIWQYSQSSVHENSTEIAQLEIKTSNNDLEIQESTNGPSIGNEAKEISPIAPKNPEQGKSQSIRANTKQFYQKPVTVIPSKAKNTPTISSNVPDKVFSELLDNSLADKGGSSNDDSSNSIADLEETITPKKKPEEKFEYPSVDDLLIERTQPVKKKSRKIWVGVAQGVGGYSNQLGTQDAAMGLATNDPTFTLERAFNSVQNEPQMLNEQLTLNTSLQVGVPIADNLTIVTGFTYNRSNFTSDAAAMNGELLHFTAENIELNDAINLTDFQAVNLKGVYEMAVMPILADWNIVSGNFNWSVQAGPEVGFLIRQQIESEELGLSRSTGPGSLYEPVHLRVALGTTFTYDLSDHFRMSLQPLMEQAVTSITKPDASFQSKPIYYSALFGLRYSF